MHHGRLIYRGQDAVALAGSATLEQVAALLWQHDGAVSLAGEAAGDDGPFVALARLVGDRRPTLGRVAEGLRQDAART